jgi:hypothetical protein
MRDDIYNSVNAFYEKYQGGNHVQENIKIQ